MSFTKTQGCNAPHVSIPTSGTSFFRSRHTYPVHRLASGVHPSNYCSLFILICIRYDMLPRYAPQPIDQYESSSSIHFPFTSLPPSLYRTLATAMSSRSYAYSTSKQASAMNARRRRVRITFCVSTLKRRGPERDVQTVGEERSGYLEHLWVVNGKIRAIEEQLAKTKEQQAADKLE